jgi:hypothetical protein
MEHSRDGHEPAWDGKLDDFKFTFESIIDDALLAEEQVSHAAQVSDTTVKTPLLLTCVCSLDDV